ncbi:MULTISPECIES: GNAT family N-acetyltransferase [Eikenella]|uniref:GNAT family N-acetyltransferase n=1 Tax=Eikenella exigua TaxID=2528037 RepID=A0AAX1F6V0_9NEIS|nr:MULTISPECIES: GNAT family N-acetyltransferase [Eikenella]OAM28935.1 diamine acetyltransferase [Eikenella sp. NML01-A-086]OAM40940.1 diamine acetyltransferase [Eikenella sp. NML97-A-109]QED91807.1 GNAT family N-acetyltransferase [Eikenella exigua]
MSIVIRKAVESDAPQLWELMKGLAVFEEYINDFAITPEVVVNSGFRKNPPDFYSFVATDGDKLVGMIVYYFLPYTLHNRPAVYIKELYVDEAYRGQNIGEKLMLVLKEEAQKHNCVQIKWTVAPWNEGGQRFYARLGAKQDNEWLNYVWSL